MKSSSPAGVGAFAQRFPVLFHVTDPGALPGIAARGLLSASALVVLYGVPEAERAALLEADRGRGNFHSLSAPGLEGAVLRDQWMPDAELSDALEGEYAGRPGAWRRMINDHVFFCLSEARANGLAKVNRRRAQIVLAFDAAGLLATHGGHAWTTPINTGIGRTRFGNIAARSEATFQPLSSFPRPDRRRPRELAVRGGVPDAMAHAVLPPSATPA